MSEAASPDSPQAIYIQPFRDLLPPNARLLVQAGGSDSVTRAYRALYPASSTMVVDADPARAEQAREYAERIYLADLSSASPAFFKQLAWADGWYFDVTLEELTDPLRVLQQVRKAMPVDACVVARIANRLYWDAPATPPRHSWSIADLLALFREAGFKLEQCVLLNSSAPPPAHEAALRERAALHGLPAETLLDAARPSHYLLKALPAL